MEDYEKDLRDRPSFLLLVPLFLALGPSRRVVPEEKRLREDAQARPFQEKKKKLGVGRRERKNRGEKQTSESGGRSLRVPLCGLEAKPFSPMKRTKKKAKRGAEDCQAWKNR